MVMQDVDFPTRPRPVTIRRKRRTLSRFEVWAWSPVFAYRIGLTISYLATIYFGISAVIAGIPTFDITAPNGWTPIWGSIVVLGAFAASIGSVMDTHVFRRIELAGAWALFVTLGVYAASLLFLAYGVGDPNRAAAGAGFVTLGVAPGVRMLWLMSQLGRKKQG